VLGFGIGGDYPVSATIMSEYASKRNRSRMVALVFSMQGAGLVIGPLVAIGLLSTGISQDYAWRIMLALGAIPALSVFWLRRKIRETPRFLLAQMEAQEAKKKAEQENVPTGIRAVLANRTMLRWLIGCSAAWLLFDFVYYGNTISSPVIVKLVAPHASLIGQTAYTLAIFAVAAVPGYLLAAFTIDRFGRKTVQAVGFGVMTVAFACLWLVPGATKTVLPFLLLFGATYFFAEFGPNTTTFVYPAELFPVQARTTSYGIAAAAGKIGGFIGTYALASLLTSAGLGRSMALVGGVSLLGLLVTLSLLPEPKGKSLEDLTENQFPGSAVALGIAESRGARTGAPWPACRRRGLGTKVSPGRTGGPRGWRCRRSGRPVRSTARYPGPGHRRQPGPWRTAARRPASRASGRARGSRARAATGRRRAGSRPARPAGPGR
jgi:MFS transporter, PHS family, inorganic phosphate transporter